MYCLVMMGLGLLAFAVYSWVPVALLRRNGQRVTAEVIGVSTDELTVRYRPPDEEPLELRVFSSGQGARVKVGQHIQVIYNPAKPEAKAIRPEDNLTVGPMVLFVVGFLVTCLGLALL